MSDYKVVQCPKCTRYQITSSEERLKCKYCNKSTVMVSKKTGHQKVKIFESFAHPKKASKYVRKLKEEKNKEE